MIPIGSADSKQAHDWFSAICAVSWLSKSPVRQAGIQRDPIINMQTPTVAARRACPAVLAFALIAPLGGCGGGGDSHPTGNFVEIQIPNSNPATGGGLWQGSLSRGGEVVNEANCLLVESGDLACVLTDTSNVYVEPFRINNRIVGAVHGFAQVSSATQASGSGKIYATPGNVLPDGSSVVAELTITGGSLGDDDHLGKYGRLELTFISLGEEYTFNGLFDHEYGAWGNLIWPVEGVYTDFNIYGDPASLSIDADGELFMQSASGCSGIGKTGKITAPLAPGMTGYLARNLDLTVSDCAGLDGAYEGMAFFIETALDDATDHLVIAAFNDMAALVGEAVR